jgi:hypothetical protein
VKTANCSGLQMNIDFMAKGRCTGKTNKNPTKEKPLKNLFLLDFVTIFKWNTPQNTPLKKKKVMQKGC